jgi:GTPase SAR1 family protein
MVLNRLQKVLFKITQIGCTFISVFNINSIGFTEQLPDINIKIILADLGKNETLQKHIKSKFGLNYKLSVGIDILTKEIMFEPDLSVNLSIWDISGENIFEIVKDIYRKEEDMTLIVFDLTKLKTYNQMNKYLSKIQEINLKQYPYILIGNKSCFLKKDGIFIYSNDVKRFAENKGCIYLEVSSELNSDVDKLFNQLAKRILSLKVQV